MIRMAPSQRSWPSPLAAGLVVLLLAGCTDSPPEEDGPLPPPPGDSGGPLGDRWLEPDIKVGPPVAVSLATFNVHNFFDAVPDPDHDDEVMDETAVKAKLDAVGAALKALDADVVALQEVENLDLLNRLNTEAGLGYKNVRLFPGNDMRGINVGLLSRFAVTRSASHAKETFKGVDGATTNYGFSRDCLEVVIEAGPGRTMTLLITHLAASEGADSLQRRYAQAARVRAIADETLKWKPTANLAVVGDLNDTPGSRTLTLIQTGSPTLFDLLTLAPSTERFTFYYGTKKEQIDYIITSPGLKADYRAGSIKADHDAVFKAASDHFPVFARFTLE